MATHAGPTFLKLLRKILVRFLIIGQSLTISGKTLTTYNFTHLLMHDLITTSRNNVKHEAKIKVLKMIGKGFVLFKINSSPSAFYNIIKPTCISRLVFK